MQPVRWQRNRVRAECKTLASAEAWTFARNVREASRQTAGLRAIEALWTAPAGSPEAEQLEILVTLVEAYEATHHPIDPPDPIDAIKLRME